MTLEESREVIPMMETMINQIEEQQNFMAAMVQELQERDRQLLSFQEQNQSLKSLNSELSRLLNLLPDTEELLSHPQIIGSAFAILWKMFFTFFIIVTLSFLVSLIKSS